MAEEPKPAPPAAAGTVSPWTFDLAQVTRKEWNQFRRGLLTDAEDTALLAKVTGMSADIIDAMPMDVSKALIRDFIKKVMEPLANPNSAAPSGTP